MTLATVAIVGRPNVGKSSLLNCLAQQRISIVEPTAGVTRDRISAVVELDGKYFELIDTGGYGIEDTDQLTEHVEQQIRWAIDSAQRVLFVVDITQGVTPLDQKVAQLLRQSDLSVLLVANKADDSRHENFAGEFFSLGFGQPICISALHGRNRKELVQRILEGIPESQTPRQTEPVMTLAVVGKRNVGKSTFINSLAGEQRMIVSEVPGTTRDAVDVRFELDGRPFIAIDTAGVRKKRQIVNDSIEFFSYTRATKSIRRAEIVLFFIDAIAEVSDVDKKLAHYIAEQFKPCIFVINKWDLAKDRATTDAYAEYLGKLMPQLNYAPISFITATEGKNVRSLIDLAIQLHKQVNADLSTRMINKALETISAERLPSVRKKIGRPKIYYGTQVAKNPPTLLLFVNNPDSFDENYKRFLINRLRDLLPISEVPIRLLLRHHRDESNESKNKTKT